MNGLLLWDIENIPFSYLEQIEKNIIYPSYFKYVVYKEKIKDSSRFVLERKGYICIHTTQIADDAINQLFDFHFNFVNRITLISTDLDFLPLMQKCEREKKKSSWIFSDANNFNILMRVKLDSNIVSLKTISLNRKKKVKRTKQNESKKEIFDYGKLGFAALKDITYEKEDKHKKGGSFNSLDLSEFKPKVEKMRKTNKEREEHIIALIKQRLNYILFEKRVLQRCDCCGNLEMVSSKDSNILFCLDCEAKFVVKYRKRKDLTHIEKVKSFLEDIENSLKKTGFILFTEEEFSFNLIEHELSKLKIASEYKLENLRDD